MNHDLRERVRRALNRSGQRDPVTPAATPAPAAGLVRFQMWCSVSGKTFTVVAAREGGDTLRMLRNEAAEDAGAGIAGGDEKLASLGSFRLEAAEWPGCPHCGTVQNFAHGISVMWLCDNWGCGKPLHCAGSRDGRFRCACGIVQERTFLPVETVPLRGSSRGPADAGRQGSGAALASPSGSALAPPSARLTFRK